MKKVYKFNLIPGVEFVEKDGFYYAASDDPIWPKSHITKVIIEGLLEYEKNNRILYRKLTFAKKTIGDRDKTIKEKDKEIRTHKNANSHLNNQIEYIKKCAENEIDHRNKLLDEKDKEIEYLRGKLREEILKSEAYIDRINTLETTLKKKDETIKKLRNTAEFANNICDGYGALTDTLMLSIEAKNSEIKVLSDQVTRLMDQIKEVMGDDTEFEQRVETETKPETNFDKMMGDMRCKSCTNGPEPCCDTCGNVDCEYRIEECREGIIKEGKSETNLNKVLHDMFISALDTWLNEDTKED